MSGDLEREMQTMMPIKLTVIESVGATCVCLCFVFVYSAKSECMSLSGERLCVFFCVCELELL